MENSEWGKTPKITPFSVKKESDLYGFDYNGIVHQEFLPEGQKDENDYYLGVMRYLREEIRKRKMDLWENNTWILHYHYAPSPSAFMIR